MGLLFKVSSSSTACTFTLFFAVRLSHLVLTLCNLEQYEVDTLLSVCFSQDSAHYCWVLLSVILFANQNFLDDFQLVVVSHFCSKTLPLNTSLFKLGHERQCLRKVEFLILVDSELASAFDGVLFGFEHLR
jgi:hypothetical protein